MAMPRVQDPQQKMMSQMMLFMPLFFAYIALTFPLGAVLYWLTSSVVGIIQQYFISGWGSLANYLKFLPADTRAQPAPGLVAAGAGAGAGGGTAVIDEGSAGAAVEEAPTQRRSFWDVVRPLVDTEAGSAAAPEQSTPATEEPPPKQTEQQSMEKARKQATPPSRGGGGSRQRRQRRRR
jgi:YidC/Oxa1 family membrane protein insertase